MGSFMRRGLVLIFGKIQIIGIATSFNNRGNFEASTSYIRRSRFGALMNKRQADVLD
jgi:hypothetical protein